jgi:hypothetical protein
MHHQSNTSGEHVVQTLSIVMNTLQHSSAFSATHANKAWPATTSWHAFDGLCSCLQVQQTVPALARLRSVALMALVDARA